MGPPVPHSGRKDDTSRIPAGAQAWGRDDLMGLADLKSQKTQHLGGDDSLSRFVEASEGALAAGHTELRRLRSAQRKTRRRAKGHASLALPQQPPCAATAPPGLAAAAKATKA